ncbi:MAG: thiamine pyrophosphate-binding protein [Nostocoides sp.]
MSQSVGRIIVEALAAEGVSAVFGVPGESYLPVLDAFNDVPGIDFVLSRHEEGAGFMADAWSRMTGRPGVFMVTRGPGMTHAAIALHAAAQDSTPLIALMGQVSLPERGREGFQEIEAADLGSLLGKGGVEITDPDRASEQIARALYLAQSGRPGPVVVSLPEDVGYLETERTGVQRTRIPMPAARAEDLEAAADLLTSGGRVAIIAGAPVGTAQGRAAVGELAELLGATVHCAWRRFDAFDNTHPHFAGNLAWLPADLLDPLRSADVLLAVGTRMGDYTSLSYSLPAPGQRFIQIDRAAASMSVVRNPDVPIVADATPAVNELVRLVRERSYPGPSTQRREEVAQIHAEYLRLSTPADGEPETPGRVDLRTAMGVLAQVLPEDAVVTSDAGSFAGYLNRYYRWRGPSTFIGSTSGPMGYGIPTAIGAKIAAPHRLVVAVAGDGGFSMTMSELQTAARLGLSKVVFIVFDNSTLGTIRQHQSLRFPGRHVGVDLGSADFAGVAEALGCRGVSCRSIAEFSAALTEAIDADRPTVLHVYARSDQIAAWA